MYLCEAARQQLIDLNLILQLVNLISAWEAQKTDNVILCTLP